MKEYNIGEKIILEVEEVTENIFERLSTNELKQVYNIVKDKE